ncbi:MAG: hypothetical protein FWD75_02335 [Propionibacteriaceae bacterium]|nr:hypothetical protein [Propionibacteriaceae bacterium]
MSRRVSKHLAPPRPLSTHLSHAEVRGGTRWIVHTMPGFKAVKAYRCPGCQSLIAPGTAHIVAWPDSPASSVDRAVDDRRHWHTPCWERMS